MAIHNRYFEETKPTYVVNVLGTDYEVFMHVSDRDDELLEGAGGYCDKTVKRIVIAAETEDAELADYSVFEKSCLRHELVHAYLTESGIDGNSTWDIAGQEHPEQMVAWIANQAPKLFKTFHEVGAL